MPWRIALPTAACSLQLQSTIVTRRMRLQIIRRTVYAVQRKRCLVMRAGEAW